MVYDVSVIRKPKINLSMKNTDTGQLDRDGIKNLVLLKSYGEEQF